MTSTPPQSPPPPGTVEIIGPVPDPEHGPVVFQPLPDGGGHPPAGNVPRGYEKAVGELLAGAWAENTRRAYASGLRAFYAFCEAVGETSEPATPSTIAAFIAELVARKVSYATIGVYVSAIRYLHHRRKHYLPTQHPVVLDAMKSAKRQLGLAPKHRKSAVSWDHLPAMVGTIDRTTVEGARDAALLLVGYGGGFRRSELVSVRLRDVAIGEVGMRIFLPRSKADQEGRGAWVEVERNQAVPSVCPVAAVEAW